MSLSENAYNAAERRHVRHAQRRAEREQREADKYIVNVMSTTAGRAWMEGILAVCGVFVSVFSTNSMQMAFNEGQRNVGLRMLSSIMALCPDQYVAMMREKDGRDRSRTVRDPDTPAERDDGPDTTDYIDYDAPVAGASTES